MFLAAVSEGGVAILTIFGLLATAGLVGAGVSLFRRSNPVYRKRELELELARMKQVGIHMEEEIAAIRAAEVKAQNEIVKP